MSIDVVGLNYPYGVPECTGKIKQYPEDFKVAEQLGFTFTGAGEHLFLYVQKKALTTHQLIDLIAQETGVQPRQIGHSGLKDKHAVTQQWLSVQLPGCKQMPVIADTQQFQILQRHWHDKKLKIGVHKSNRFDIVIRDIPGKVDNLSSIIEQIKNYGFANYFGEQRFGVQQDNVEQAVRVLNNRHKCKRLTRTKKSLYISALRSELFNQILDQRIKQGIWQQPIDGDVCMLAGSQSVFVEPLSDQIRQRYKEFDIHSGISLFGSGESRLTKQALDIENEVFTANPEICATLLDQKVKRSFRANRVQAKNLKVEYLPEQAEIHVQVELDKGTYLTTLLNHFVTI
ncbi:MAG: tRNA pseudouridine(13) synthase TruD [Gammaproteobacteria bacterium]|nr:tRNA pseudouridine(13) synthase TruD [Gammaproteobacteria bacterium]